MGARPSFPIRPLPRDRIVVVTGGNTGLGYEISKWLAMMGATVIIACRSEQRALKAIERMNEEYDKTKEELSSKHGVTVYDNLAVSFMLLDLSSFKSTLNFVQKFKESGRNLHVLICNAGIGMTPYERTEDGFEKMLQVNYLSHFLIVAKLLPVMEKSGPDCRILLMSSDAHRACQFDLDTMNYEGSASTFGRLDYYGRSKLYQIMQMYSLTRRLAGTNITINSSHPGIVETEINRGFQDSFFWNVIFFRGTKVLGKMKTPVEGATSLINAAVTPILAGVSGMYFYDCKDNFKTATAQDVNKQEALWRKTLDYLKNYITDEERVFLEGKSS